MRAIVLTLLLVFGSTVFSFSQQKAAQPPKIRLGIGMLASAYSGDLNYNGEQLYRFYPGMNFSLLFGKVKLISPQLNMGFGKFVSQNRLLVLDPQYAVNKYVETSFFYADFRLKVRFLRKSRIHPYFSLGPELFNFTPRDEKGNALSDNLESRKEEEIYGSVAFAFPMSLGFDLKLSHVFGLNAEYTFRPTNSDYLDNIGLLGLKSGKDKVNTFLLGFYVNFDPDYPIVRSFLRTKERTR